MNQTHWGDVQYALTPDGGETIRLTLDGQEYTMECILSPVVALRLGQALVEIARKVGLPAETVDP